MLPLNLLLVEKRQTLRKREWEKGQFLLGGRWEAGGWKEGPQNLHSTRNYEWKHFKNNESPRPICPTSTENREKKWIKKQKTRNNKCFIELRHPAQVWVILILSFFKKPKGLWKYIEFVSCGEQIFVTKNTLNSIQS